MSHRICEFCHVQCLCEDCHAVLFDDFEHNTTVTKTFIGSGEDVDISSFEASKEVELSLPAWSSNN